MRAEPIAPTETGAAQIEPIAPTETGAAPTEPITPTETGAAQAEPMNQKGPFAAIGAYLWYTFSGGVARYRN